MIDERKKKIDEVREKVRNNTARREELVVSLGHIAWQKKEQAAGTGPYDRTFADIQRLEKEAAGYSDMILQIRNTINKRKELEELHTALKEEMKTLENDFRGTYEGIGRAAYSAYGEGLLKEDDFPGMFSDIAKTEENLESTRRDREKMSTEADPDNMFKKIADKSKNVLAASKIKAGESKLGRLYQRLGKAFCSSAVLKNLEDASLQGIFAPFRDDLEDISRLKDKDEEILSEKQDVDKDLTRMGVSKGEKKRIGELEQSIADCRDSVRDFCLDAGNLLLEKDCRGYEKVTDVQRVYGNIKDLDEATDALKDNIAVLETTRQIEDLKALAADRDEAIRRNKERIEKLNEENKEHQKRKKKLQTEIRQLEKTLEPEEDA